MAGSLFGLGLSQQQDEVGDPLSGGFLYIYDANTSTPAITYADFSLTSIQAWPLELDSAGRIPAFWVDDGSYRARLTTSGGVEIFDEQSITSIGASAGDSGGSVAQDTTTIFQTGDFLWAPVTGTRSGWARCNGRTIGSGSSGATERANSDTQALYEFFWNNFSDSLCAVATGRGASASADFSANKAIATLDMRGRAPFGLDDMGNSSASVLTAGTPTAAGSSGGAEKQTIATGNLPSHTHGAGSFAVATTITNGTSVARGSNSVGSGSGGTGTTSTATLSLADGTVTGTSGSTGSGTALTTTPPYRVGSWYAKL